MLRDWIAKDIPVIKSYSKFFFWQLKRRWWVPAGMVGFYILTLHFGVMIHSGLAFLIGFMLGGYWAKPDDNQPLFPPSEEKRTA